VAPYLKAFNHGSTGQMFAVTFYAKKSIKVAIKNSRVEVGVKYI
jgi:hypothetical protein